MKKILKSTLNFSLRLLLGLGIIFSIHQFINHLQDISFNGYLILEAYVANYFLVVLSYLALIYFKHKESHALGFIFLFGFFLKLAVFLIFFNPYYKQDNEIQTVEFLSFFTSYSYCLIYETYVLVKLLNRS